MICANRNQDCKSEERTVFTTANRNDLVFVAFAGRHGVQAVLSETSHKYAEICETDIKSDGHRHGENPDRVDQDVNVNAVRGSLC